MVIVGVMFIFFAAVVLWAFKRGDWPAGGAEWPANHDEYKFGQG
jgi:hypothetical protein